MVSCLCVNPDTKSVNIIKSKSENYVAVPPKWFPLGIVEKSKISYGGPQESQTEVQNRQVVAVAMLN